MNRKIKLVNHIDIIIIHVIIFIMNIYKKSLALIGKRRYNKKTNTKGHLFF